MTNPLRSGEGISGAALAALVTLATVGVAAVVTLVVLGRPVDTVLSLLTIILVPTITGILNANKIDKVSDKVDAVASNVNGRMSQLINSRTTTDAASIEEGRHSAD